MDKYTRERIENITETDFWSSFRRGVKAVCPAIEAGQAGDRVTAYTALQAYHAESLGAERAACLEKWGPACAHLEKSEVQKNREKADEVMRHNICGWHTHRIQFGPVIDFNADFGRSGQYGFHYLGWLYPLLQEYTFSGEEQYAREFLTIMGQYYDQRASLNWRIPNLHPVYYELGVAAKAPLLIAACSLLAPTSLPDAATYEGMMKLLLGFGRSLFRIQKNGYKSGNWQIVGARTLYALGCVFSEFREAAQWRRRAEQLLDDHLKRDFFSDGGHSERCWGYGWMSLNGMLNHYRDALRYGHLDKTRKTRWTRFLKRAFRWFAQSTAPGNQMLNYGDGHISSADPLLDAVGDVFPDLMKGSGIFGVDRSRSCCLSPSGYAFMRAGNGDGESPFMSINFGRYGGGHTHPDLLDFSLWCYGRPLIEEVGRFDSYDQPLDPFFRSPEAHNQIVLPHLWMKRQAHQGEDIHWHSTEQADFFSGVHYAYEQAAIRRQILFIKPEPGVGTDGILPDLPGCCWLIYDVITAKESIFQVQNILHAPRPLVTEGLARRIVGDPSCLILCGREGDIRRTTTDVDYSRDDRGSHPSPWDAERHRLTFWKWRDIGDSRPITFLTLLAPFRGEQVPQATIAEIELSDPSGEAGAFRITLDKRKFTAVFNPVLDPGVMAAVGQAPSVVAPLAVQLDSESWLTCP